MTTADREMKKILLIIASVAVSLTAGAQSTSKYDVNGDGSVNAADIVAIVNYIMGRTEEAKAPAGAVAVDLGLPSGTKWANMNVGAEKPEDYGLYFAWGETKGYTSDTSDGRFFDWANYKLCNGSGKTLTKYCTDASYGTVDNKTTLDLDDDAAYVNWGKQWRMPTIDEIREMLDNTTAEWTTVNGVYGCKFTASNGNFIFLPAAGSRRDYMVRYQGSWGDYWSASLDTSYSRDADGFVFGSDSQSTYGTSIRYDGYTVRPVLRN